MTGFYTYPEHTPFGVEILTVVASRSPLDTHQGKPDSEPVSQYLERFAQRLEVYKAQGDVAIAYIRTRTRQAP